MIKITLSNDILKYITEIDKNRYNVSSVKLSKTVANKLRKNSKKKSSYASNKIEGNPLSEKQVDEVIESDDRKHFLKPEQEVRNYFLALNFLEEKVNRKEAFSKELILDVQKLVEKGASKEKIGFRGPMPPGVLFAVYDSKTGNSDYIPPEYTDIPELIDELVEYVNTTDDHPLLVAAVVHYQLVTLHPFEDGNGRLARAIADMALCRGDKIPESGPRVLHEHLFSMSAQLYKERKDYYQKFQEIETAGSMDITSWLLWYTVCMNRAVLNVMSELEEGQQRREFWNHIESLEINERQRKVLTMLLGDFKGKLTSTKYAKICNCSQDTASRDIEKLIKAGILIKGECGGRSTNYLLKNWISL